MNKKRNQASVGAAVVGLGRGQTHIHALLRAEGAELLAVCDKNKETAERSAAQHGVDAYTDLSELLQRDDIDLVHVCTPSGLHTDMLLQIAESGKHAITEKPLDITLDRIDRALAAFEQRKLQLGCIFQIRLMPAVRHMKQAVESGRLGKLVLANAHIELYRTKEYYEQNGGWRGTWAWDGGGSLMNQAIHTIDLLQWMMGPVQSVIGHTQVSTHQIETEDTGVALLKFANGACGTIAGTTSAYPGFGTSLDIFGENGGIGMRNNQISTWKIHGDNMVAEEADVIGNAELNVTSDTTNIQIQDMVDAVRYNRPPLITGKEGRDAVEIVLAIYESARKSKEVWLC
ncbi:Gfo/Idh/MocA family protein [Paenibacillus hodogayensis]|uniref:Gfo/Idh/MocA family protein n=1 Tax=Paenibacillus hodogayensis TaxID=279208 RepID=A0ABV5W705_9BACL